MTHLGAGELIYEVRFDSDFHTGTGFSQPGGADDMLDRDTEGRPRVLGRRMKGKILDGARQAVLSIGIGEPAATSLLAAVFGAGHESGASSEGHFRFLSARQPDALAVGTRAAERSIDRRSHNSVNSRTGRAADDALFSREVLRREVVLRGRIVWDSTTDQSERDLVVVALRMVEGLGAKNRRGEGACRIEVLSIPGETGDSIISNAFDRLLEARHARHPHLADPSPDRPAVSPESEHREDWQVTIEPLEPILLGRDRSGGNALRGLDFVPGTQLRGALAAQLLSARVATDSLDWMFSPEGIHVSHAYPGSSDEIPLPLSVRRSKHRDQARLLDTLLRPLQPQEGRERHPVTQEPLERVGPRFLSAGSGLTPPAEVKTAVRETVPGIEIDPARGRTRDNRFFTIDALSPSRGLRFSASLSAPPAAGRELLDALGLESSGGTFELSSGALRSTGFGRVRCAINRVDVDAEGEAESVRRRFRALNESTALLALGLGRQAFTVTLVSDAIVLDEWLRFRGGLHTEDLWPDPARRALVDPFPLRAVTATGIARSWHGRSGLPRPDDATITAGAVFLFQLVEQASEDQMVEALHALETGGVGCRRHEGFGRLITCLTWHHSWAVDAPADPDRVSEEPLPPPANSWDVDLEAQARRAGWAFASKAKLPRNEARRLLVARARLDDSDWKAELDRRLGKGAAGPANDVPWLRPEAVRHWLSQADLGRFSAAPSVPASGLGIAGFDKRVRAIQAAFLSGWVGALEAR